MKHNYKRSAYADNAHGGCRKRAGSGVAQKALRSVNGLLRGLGRGILNAVKAWTDAAPVKGAW